MRRALACLALVACSALPGRPEPGERYHLEPVGAWTRDELAELVGACDAWRTFTEGALDCVITSSSPDGAIVRTHVEGEWYGENAAIAREIRIDADRMLADGWSTRDVGSLARNLMGQAAGMDLHDEAGVLSRGAVSHEFTEADRASCRAAGWCR